MRHGWMMMAALLLAMGASASETNGYSVSVLVDDSPRAEYRRDGTVYIEALRGREFAIRLTNPMPYRVGVALSVDGLNTIDARHTDAWSAAKWILEPYQTMTISGWQVNQETARKFYFTGERSSYGAAIGQTQNLGVIEAVFYRERRRPAAQRREAPMMAPPPAPKSQPRAESDNAAGAGAAPSDDYAATGMGDRTRHDIDWVHIDLDPTPVASARIRYEFRAQLVKLGVIPDERPLDRRERARGFGTYCPEP
jgi:hypothetical protein